LTVCYSVCIVRDMANTNIITVGSKVRRIKIDRHGAGDVAGTVVGIKGEKAKVAWQNWYGIQVSSIGVKSLRLDPNFLTECDCEHPDEEAETRLISETCPDHNYNPKSLEMFV
jgi:hypothetical protein